MSTIPQKNLHSENQCLNWSPTEVENPDLTVIALCPLSPANAAKPSRTQCAKSGINASLRALSEGLIRFGANHVDLDHMKKFGLITISPQSTEASAISKTTRPIETGSVIKPPSGALLTPFLCPFTARHNTMHAKSRIARPKHSLLHPRAAAEWHDRAPVPDYERAAPLLDILGQ